MKSALAFGLLVLLGWSVSAEPLLVGEFQLTLGKGFQVLLDQEDQRVQIRTPGAVPVSVVALGLGSAVNWESAALDFLLTEYRRTDPKILPEDQPIEISVKREGPWTTIYWTYGGTRSYFGMYWGGRNTGALLFWASPLRAPGRSQYQALSEVTKGILVTKG